MLDWDNLRFFLTAVRTGNYTTAAKRLRVDRTTVGRRLDRLEHQLRIPLFEQGGDGYYPTATGRRVLRLADDIEMLVADFESELETDSGGSQVELRLAVATELGSELMEDLAGFSRSYPHIQLRIHTSSEPADDVIARKSEVGLCLLDQVPDHLRGLLAGTLRQAGYASGNYLDARGHGLEPQEYDWVRCSNSSRVHAMKRWDAIFCHTVRVAAIVDSWPDLRHSVEHGIGAALLWTFVADRLPGLIRITPLQEELGVGLHILVRDDVPVDQHTRQFMTDMAGRLSRRLAAS